MPSDKNEPGVSHLSSGHFSDAGALSNMSGWDLSFRQLDPGPHSIEFYLLQTKRITVLKIFYNRGFHQYGCTPRGMVTVGIPEEGAEDWFGLPYQDSTILPFNQASGIDLVSRSGFTAYSISIAKDFLWDVAARCQIPVADSLTDARSGAVIPASRAVRNLRNALRGYYHNGRVSLDYEEEEALVKELLLTGLGDADVLDKSTPSSRAQAIASALEYLELNPIEAVTVGEICAAIGVSWRTLDRAFTERFRIGPKAYLQRTRLSRTRADLLTSEAGKLLVSDVANKWGFWHMGQFAHDYRNLYGELPSKTLERVSY